MDDKVWISVLALALALFTLLWRLRDERVSYLQISLSLIPPADDVAIAKTSICNESVRIKKLGAVFLLIGPEKEDPIDTFNSIVGQNAEEACCAIDFERLVPNVAQADRTGLRQLIPLKYFTEENDNVGDETLSYSVPIDLGQLSPGARLSVRFYVFGYRRAAQNYHRKVQDLLVVPNIVRDQEGAATKEVQRAGKDKAADPTVICLDPALCRSIKGCPRKIRLKKAGLP